MYPITARNINDAYGKGLQLLDTYGIAEQSRNGLVLSMRMPVSTTYANPTERVLFSPHRDANPFFHLMEGLWMLQGRNDAEWVGQFNKRMLTFAEHDGKLHGAYGHRWRRHWGFDQIGRLATMLRNEPTTRRAVLTMFDPLTDLGANVNDIPCNTHIYFRILDDSLHMTVCCRSNDAIWGAYGANAVHMSMLQEVIAGLVGIGVGSYTQISNNFHIYPDNPGVWECMAHPSSPNMYRTHTWNPYPMVQRSAHWFDDLHKFFTDPWDACTFSNPFFPDVAIPVMRAWILRKEGDRKGTWASMGQIQDKAWQHACQEWVARRENKS